MKIFKSARKKLADKPVTWEECYTPDTAYFKAMYDSVIGEGSYFRFEGKDADTGDWHMVIVGPAKMHDPEAKFFAGQRKLPATYSASGEYFANIKEALYHANEHWGISIPTDSDLSLTSSNLKGLRNKIDKWREDNSKEDILRTFDKQVTDPKNDPKSASASGFKKIAMAVTRFRNRKEASRYFDIDKLDRDGMPEDWDQIVQRWPNIVVELEYARGLRDSLRRKLERYGSQARPDMHKIYLCNSTELDKDGEAYGSHILSVGPYLGTKFSYAVNMFSPFLQSLTVVSREEMQANLAEMINKYRTMYGVQLTERNFDLPEQISNAYIQNYIVLNSETKEDIAEQLADDLNISRGSRGWKTILKNSIENQQREFLRASQPTIPVENLSAKEINDHIVLAWKSYQAATERGENVPKPPTVYVNGFGNDRRVRGQLRPSSVVKYPAFKVIGNLANGATTISIQPSIEGHGLRRIGAGSVIKLATYNKKGDFKYGKREYVVSGFDVGQGSQGTITLEQPLNIDVKLPNADNPFFNVFLLNVERRVDTIPLHGQQRVVDWSLKNDVLAEQLGIEKAEVRELRGAYEAKFYGFNNMQAALDYSEIRGRPKGLERLVVERNYTTEDLNQFAELANATRIEADDPDDKDEDDEDEDGDIKDEVAEEIVKKVDESPKVDETPKLEEFVENEEEEAEIARILEGKEPITEVKPTEKVRPANPMTKEKVPATPVQAQPAPAAKPSEEIDEDEEINRILHGGASKTIGGISALASELGKNGKFKAQEEVKNILRKYMQ